jgi:hypothetical protein
MGRKRRVYTPAELVNTEVLTPVAVFSETTFAPETRAPLGSVTTPAMEPVTVCPEADDNQNRAINQLANK